jgi:hypothetical protein
VRSKFRQHITPETLPSQNPKQQSSGSYRQGIFNPRFGAGMAGRCYANAASKDENAKAFLFWSRMPVISSHPNGLEINDQRFLNPLMKDSFTVQVSN